MNPNHLSSTFPEGDNLGHRIREERRNRHLTLEQLSQSTKLSKSFLSQVERGSAQPSISSLKKIAHQFGMSVVNLFSDPANQNNGPEGLPSGPGSREGEENYIKDVRVVRADRRKKIILPGSKVIYQLLTPDLNRRMEAIYMRIAPGVDSGEESLADPPGEKFGVVLSGILEVRVGEEVHQLRAGDSIYFPAHYPLYWHGLGKEPVEALFVLTPPWF